MATRTRTGLRQDRNPPTQASSCRIRSEWIAEQSGLAFPPDLSSGQTRLELDADISCHRAITTSDDKFVGGIKHADHGKDDATVGTGNVTVVPQVPPSAHRGGRAQEPGKDHGAIAIGGVELVPCALEHMVKSASVEFTEGMGQPPWVVISDDLMGDGLSLPTNYPRLGHGPNNARGHVSWGECS